MVPVKGSELFYSVRKERVTDEQYYEKSAVMNETHMAILATILGLMSIFITLLSPSEPVTSV